MARNASKSNQYLPELFIVVGITLVVISSLHNFLRWRSLRLDDLTVAAYQTSVPAEVAPKPVPTHIFIKWYIDVDIDEEVYVDGVWTVSENHASYLASSARPGEAGNLILYGHNQRTIMGNLRALKGYETITLTLSDGSTRDYQIVSQKEVKPTDTRLLQPTDSEVLTLYTCSGFMDSRRYVVRAVPVIQPNPAVAF